MVLCNEFSILGINPMIHASEIRVGRLKTIGKQMVFSILRLTIWYLFSIKALRIQPMHSTVLRGQWENTNKYTNKKKEETTTVDQQQQN